MVNFVIKVLLRSNPFDSKLKVVHKLLLSLLNLLYNLLRILRFKFLDWFFSVFVSSHLKHRNMRTFVTFWPKIFHFLNEKLIYLRKTKIHEHIVSVSNI